MKNKLSEIQMSGAVAMPLLWGFVLFTVMCLTSVVSVLKNLTVFGVIGAVLCLFVCRDKLVKNISLAGVALSMFVVLSGASTLYALSGKFALQEFLKVLLGFCLFIMIRALSGEKSEFGVAGIMATSTAWASLISIDMISTRWISGIFSGFLNLFVPGYELGEGIEVGVRMTSVFTNPNVFAGCVGLGVLVSLALANASKGAKMRNLYLVCLYLNALAFLLAFSMGASGTILVAFLVFLLAEKAEMRSSLLVLMVEVLVLTALAVFPIFVTAFDTWKGVQVVPVLCAIIGSGLLCVVDAKFGQRLAQTISNRGKVLWMTAGSIVVVLGVFVALAMNLTGTAHLGERDTLRRSAYPAPGAYTLVAELDGNVNVVIESQNENDTMMHTNSVLYSGSLEQADFEVPTDSVVVWFNFTAKEESTLHSVDLAGTEEISLKLNYTLLPGFIANRLQGLMANQNAIQRTVFFRDGMKLMSASPIIGLGMGSFETAILSVQSFFYETKYVHNHYIQVLLEVGVLGCVFFVGALVLWIIALVKGWKQSEKSPLLAGALASLVFLMGHASVELTMSSNRYLLLAFMLFALACQVSDGMMPLPKKEKLGQYGVYGLATVTTLYGGMLAMNMYASSYVAGSSADVFMDRLATASEMDQFEWTDYALTYVVRATNGADSKTLAQANDMAERLGKVSSNTIPLYLGQFYFAQGDVAQGGEQLTRYVLYKASNSQAWNQGFQTLFDYGKLPSNLEYKALVEEMYDLFTQWNENQMGTLVLDEFVEVQLGVWLQ